MTALLAYHAPPIGGPSAVHLADASAWAVFAFGAAFIVIGALGVVLLRNPVHCALMLVVTLFGVFLEFINEAADFLAAVQIIVYAGAIVILFLFVIMFLGVDRKEMIGKEPIKGQRPLAAVVGLAFIIEILVLSQVHHWASGARAVSGPLQVPGTENVKLLGQSIYTRYLLPFEMTAALLVIAVVATVVLARRRERVASELRREEQDTLPPRPTGANGGAGAGERETPSEAGAR